MNIFRRFHSFSCSWKDALYIFIYIFIFVIFRLPAGTRKKNFRHSMGTGMCGTFKWTSLVGEYCLVFYILKQIVKALYLVRKSDNIDWVSLRNVCSWNHLGHNGKGDGSLQANHFDTSIVGMYHSPGLPCRLACCRQFWTCSPQQCKQYRLPLVVFVWLIEITTWPINILH